MADAFALPIRKLEDQDVDPATFTLIVTALSGLSAFLSIGQTGFQFSRSNKKVKEVVENEYFLDVTTIDKRETRNDVKAILDKLRKITPHANYTIKTLQRHIMARVVMYCISWLVLVLSIAWTLPPLTNVSILGIKITEYFVLTLLLAFSIALLNGYLPWLAKRIGLQTSKRHFTDFDSEKLVLQLNRYRETVSKRASTALRVFGFRELSELEKEFLETYMGVVEALSIVQTEMVLASLRTFELRALRLVEEVRQRDHSLTHTDRRQDAKRRTSGP